MVLQKGPERLLHKSAFHHFAILPNFTISNPNSGRKHCSPEAWLAKALFSAFIHYISELCWLFWSILNVSIKWRPFWNDARTKMAARPANTLSFIYPTMRGSDGSMKNFDIFGFFFFVNSSKLESRQEYDFDFWVKYFLFVKFWIFDMVNCRAPRNKMRAAKSEAE